MPVIDATKIAAAAAGFSQARRGPASNDPNLLPTSQPAGGAFREPCTFSHFGYNDPIVYPGQPGKSHLHVFVGNSNADANLTAANILSAPASTCDGGTLNKSAYWVPAMVDTGTNTPLVPSSFTVYYKNGWQGVLPGQIKTVPTGLRMISGDAKNAGAGGVASYTCEDAGTDQWTSGIPVCPAGARVVMNVDFPQCWDGVNLDSPDHKSHMAWPAGNGCPSTHPVALPFIEFQVKYRVASAYTSGQLRLSSDNYDRSQPGGYSGHGDYFMGWDPAIIQIWTKRCLNDAFDCHGDLLGDGTSLY